MKTIDDFLLEKRLAESTKSQYRRILGLLVDAVGDVEGLTAARLNEWLLDLSGGECYRWLAFCAARSFLRWGWGDTHAALKLKIKRVGCAPGRVLDAGQSERLLSYFDRGTVKGLRDSALAALLLDTGLRESEACRLDVRYLDLPRCELSVLCKGGEYQYVIFSRFTAGWLGDWLEARRGVAGAGCRAVFVGLGGVKPGSRLTPSGLRVIVRVWGIKVGIGALSPHDFRRTFATLSTRAGAPSRLVQVAGRWSSLEMVVRYTQGIELEDFRRYLPVPRIVEKV